MFTEAMPAAELHARLIAKVEARHDLVHSRHELAYRAGTWDLLRIASKDIGPDDPVVVVRATIHGDEIAGALTVLNYLDELVAHAHARGVKLVVYPLGNPSGFDLRVRYNADHHMGEGNNDFLRYVMEDGSVRGDLPVGVPFARWLWADDPDLGLDLPVETRLMLELVRKDPLQQVVAAFDLHQDYVTEGLGPCTYQYAFGDLDRYTEIVRRVHEVVPPLADVDVSAGFGEQIDEHGHLLPHEGETAMRSDDLGFIVRHDGTFSDFYQRMGVPHSIATETSGATPMADACLVNWIWLTGVIDLVSAES
ncbi:MAG TPA: hypothetical protein VFZ64_00450 [Nocardioidaceae bacterium]